MKQSKQVGGLLHGAITKGVDYVRRRNKKKFSSHINNVAKEREMETTRGRAFILLKSF